jgi:predicted Rossmann fold nucleotide-binding protein DprA/Smf involved in DNA uptake
MKSMFNYQENYLNGKKIFLLGNETILHKKKIGVFVSRAIPLNIIIPAEDFLLSLSELSYVFTSGWHSPFEKRILKKLLSTDKETVFFTSKGIKNQSLYKYFKKAINEERLLIASLLLEKTKVTLNNSIVRNEMIADIAEHNLFVFIKRGGNLENLFNKLLRQNKVPLIFNHSANYVFLKKGKPIGLENFKEVLL